LGNDGAEPKMVVGKFLPLCAMAVQIENLLIPIRFFYSAFMRKLTQ
jgi:hypothetical protein